VSLDLSGTVMIYTLDSTSYFVMLAGRMRVLALGQVQVIFPGQQVSVPYNPGDLSQPANVPTAPQPLDFAMIRYLPVALLDHPILLPQPGYVETQGIINLRAAPSTGSSLLAQVPSGEVLGVDRPEGSWYHVERTGGEPAGCSPTAAPKRRHDQATYKSTPMPPQRPGPLGTEARERRWAWITVCPGRIVRHGWFAAL
jgi:hypothetical protein